MSFQRVEDVLKKYFTALAFSKHWFHVLVHAEISGWKIIAFGNISTKTFWRMCFSCFYEPMHNLFHVKRWVGAGAHHRVMAPPMSTWENRWRPLSSAFISPPPLFTIWKRPSWTEIISESGKNQKFWWLKYPQSNVVDTRQANNTKTLSSCLILINIWKLSFLFLLGLQRFLSPISLLPGPNFYPLICS